ncbi:hypothetical protein MHL31_08505 [Lutibacter sp. A80]|uniref:NifB/NifX family molybdenum-iron cluster-binding protein n=1 Tax=Lutibacter sp. A80 TaxID=2918453 RepID=UPI001F055F01|nr:NifB/NifX family molybdenum-iron cluster-binding protein [Lutibacter sp. A80]UMB59123.1 hypothetical protein MHL31_08505 [Lutibacter sp. A80]
MKTIISATGNNINSQFDLRFGRAPYFCVIENGNLEHVTFYKNHILNSEKDAGISAAKNALKLKATKIISGEYGNHSKKILDANNIQLIMISEENCTIKDILDRLKNKQNKTN